MFKHNIYFLEGKILRYYNLLRTLALIVVILSIIGLAVVYIHLILGYDVIRYISGVRETVEQEEAKIMENGSLIYLPLPVFKGNISLEEAILYRRSIREYLDKPLTLRQLSQLLWAAQGITETHWGFRASPSAGATYPLEVYVVVGENGVEGLNAGVYRYRPHSHSLVLVRSGDIRMKLYEACLNQEWVRDAPVVLVIAAEYERTTRIYGERGIRYVHMEVGHVGQNIYLEATALGLGTVAVGAFYDDDVRVIIGAPENHHPLYVMPIGVPVKPYRVSAQEIYNYIEAHRG